MKILVAGATGTLGEEICQRLRRRDVAVRGLVRQSASRARLEALKAAGVDLCWGDLKDPASLRRACYGVDVVISTASSTLSRQENDSIESVDRQGQLSLVMAARAAGVEHFTFVSIPRRPVRESSLTRAKARDCRRRHELHDFGGELLYGSVVESGTRIRLCGAQGGDFR